MKTLYGKKRGMAIPLVLGFVLVSTLLGTTLLFLSKNRGADAVRTVGRFQHWHMTQMGLSQALATIKTMRFSEIIAKKGLEWSFNTGHEKFGKADGWCEVKVKTRGDSEVEITSTGCWQDHNSPLRRRSFSCTARYHETRNTESSRYSTMVKIEGEWKISRFSEDIPDSDEN